MEGALQPKISMDLGGDNLCAAQRAEPQRSVSTVSPILQETLCFLQLLGLGKQLPQAVVRKAGPAQPILVTLVRLRKEP